MANRPVQGEDLGKAIVSELYKYNREVQEVIRERVDKASKAVKSGIQKGAPVGKTKRYRAGWAIKQNNQGANVSRIIHNAKVPGLPHLLEHGHASRNGGRVRAIPHIAPVVERELEDMEYDIVNAIQNGGEVMDAQDLYAGLAEAGYPVAYREFKDAQEPPFVTFYFLRDASLYADDVVYHRMSDYAIELYMDRNVSTATQTAAEAAIEASLTDLGLPFGKEEIPIDSESMSMTLYTVRIPGTESESVS